MKVSKSTVEAVKEGGRLLVVVVTAFVVSYLVESVLPTMDQNTVVVVVTIALKAVDKYIHKTNRTKLKGLVPF